MIYAQTKTFPLKSAANKATMVLLPRQANILFSRYTIKFESGYITRPLSDLISVLTIVVVKVPSYIRPLAIFLHVFLVIFLALLLMFFPIGSSIFFIVRHFTKLPQNHQCVQRELVYRTLP